MSPPTPPTPMEPFDVENVLSKLSTTEKIKLLSGNVQNQITIQGPCSSTGLHSSKSSISGIQKASPDSVFRNPILRWPKRRSWNAFFNGAPAACFPCGTALAATWSMSLLREAGALMGEEAIAKGVHVLLGPTANMQRSPLGGKGFESFSEDPILAGHCAAEIASGIQQTEVVAAIKPFVANDQEHQRMAL